MVWVVKQAVGANGEIPGTDELDAGAKRVMLGREYSMPKPMPLNKTSVGLRSLPNKATPLDGTDAQPRYSQPTSRVVRGRELYIYTQEIF